MAVILLVDDDSLVRVTLRKMLTSARHAVIEVGSGVEAEELAAGRAIDLVITDILMPDKEGLSLLRDIKRNRPNLKIIAISGGGRTGAYSLLEAATQLGADAVLRKPFAMAELLATVSSLLGGGQAS
jgi:two-component system chemotaxis response regulator CheY